MDTILAAGAEGECPEQLLALARAVGIGAAELNFQAMDAIISKALAIDPNMPQLAVELSLAGGGSVKGAFITQPVWDALRLEAARLTGLLTPPIAPSTAKVEEIKQSAAAGDSEDRPLEGAGVSDVEPDAEAAAGDAQQSGETGEPAAQEGRFAASQEAAAKEPPAAA